MTEAEYRAAIERIGVLMAGDPALGTVDGDELSRLADLVIEYENARWPIA